MSASLSSLPRAALAAKEGYWWINGIALALSCVIAWMSWSAYSEAGQSDRALVCIVSQGLAIALAILARRAFTGQMPWAGAGAFALAAGCAWWASHGLALAWYDDAERNGELMVIFMAALEPALFLLAEHVKEGRETLRAAHTKAEAETAAELAAIRERDAARERPRLATLDGIALGAGGVALTMSGASAQSSAPSLMAAHVSAHPSDRAPIVSTNTGYPSARHHVLALYHEGVTKRADLHRITGVRLSTVSSWARQIEAGTFKVAKEA